MMAEAQDSHEIDIARRIYALQQQKDGLEEKLQEVKNNLTLALDEMKCFLVDEGKSSTGHIEGIGNFSLKRDSYPSVPAAQMPPFLDWLESVGDASLIKHTVEPRVLRKYLNERIEALANGIEEARKQHADSSLLWAAVWTRCKESVGLQHSRALEKLYGVGAREPLKRDDFVEMDAMELATKIFGVLGVTSFTEYKVSHTGKGKSKL